MPLDLYVMHTGALLNPIFRRALHFLQPTKHDPILRQFPNAGELRNVGVRSCADTAAFSRAAGPDFSPNE